MKKNYFLFLNITTVLFFVVGGGCYVRSTKTHKQQTKDRKIPFLSLGVLGKKLEEGVARLSKHADHQVMVVFVHGTMLPIPSLRTIGPTFKRYFSKNKKIKKSLYSTYILNLRERSVFQFQPLGALGLHKISSSDVAQKVAYAYSAIYRGLFGQRNDDLLFYTFGWEGHLNHKHRTKVARQFYNQLHEEYNKVKNKLLRTSTLELIIIGHSHGGNVALNLAHAVQEKEQAFKVNKLVLLGTPAQNETVPLLNSPLFEKIYHIYSRGDSIQVLDVLSTKSHRSARRFGQLKNVIEPEKLVNIEVKVDKKLPAHAELWFLGGRGNFLYRKNFGLYPYPVASFVPALVYSLDNYMPHVRNVRAVINKFPQGYTFSFQQILQKNEDKNIHFKDYAFSLDLSNIKLQMGTVKRE